jgi:hypothetical protein
MTDAQDARIEQLTQVVERLQAQVAQLSAPREGRSPAPTDEAARPVDRRRMLKGAGLAAAGAAALVVAGKASPAGAVVDPSIVANEETTSTTNTVLHYVGSESNNGVIFLTNETGDDPTTAVFPAALGGWAAGFKVSSGVYGFSSAANGFGVVGSVSDGATGAVGVFGRSGSGGAGVRAQGQNTSRGLEAASDGSQAMWAHLDNSANSSTCLRAETAGSGSGVFGVSAKGTGGKFQGKTAQIQLVPSPASTHPASGSAGQLFVDAAKRLWFCKGGTTWLQIA